MEETKNKGITLVALVVTIVVLLILAGISLSLVLGNNGIITKANEAAKKTREAQIEEELQLKLQGEYIDSATKDDEEGELDPSILSAMNIVGVDKLDLCGDTETNITYVIIHKDDKFYNAQVITDNNGLKISNVEERNVGPNELEVAFYKIISGDEEVKEAFGDVFIYNNTFYIPDSDCESVPNHVIRTIEAMQMAPMKVKVNSGDDGKVILPIAGHIAASVDWGDSNSENVEKRLSEDQYEEVSHQYTNKNAEYTITINGLCSTWDTWLLLNEDSAYLDKFIEVSDWGTTILTDLKFAGCKKLNKIASSNENSFKCIEKFQYTFTKCESLQNIPDDLFAHCINTTSFDSTFSYCTGITSIPATLFDNCKNATEFDRAFSGCSSITSNAPKLWEKVVNGEPVTGYGCFNGCSNIANKTEIPRNWVVILQ